MFDDLNKIIAEGHDRWQHIDKLTTSIQSQLEAKEDVVVNDVAALLVALVEHLRPMNPSKDQLGEATQGLKDLLNSLK